jgi:hypothetical protein
VNCCSGGGRWKDRKRAPIRRRRDAGDAPACQHSGSRPVAARGRGPHCGDVERFRGPASLTPRPPRRNRSAVEAVAPGRSALASCRWKLRSPPNGRRFHTPAMSDLSAPNTELQLARGRVSAVRGNVVDVRFPDAPPPRNRALHCAERDAWAAPRPGRWRGHRRRRPPPARCDHG